MYMQDLLSLYHTRSLLRILLFLLVIGLRPAIRWGISIVELLRLLVHVFCINLIMWFFFYFNFLKVDHFQCELLLICLLARNCILLIFWFGIVKAIQKFPFFLFPLFPLTELWPLFIWSSLLFLRLWNFTMELVKWPYPIWYWCCLRKPLLSTLQFIAYAYSFLESSCEWLYVLQMCTWYLIFIL